MADKTGVDSRVLNSYRTLSEIEFSTSSNEFDSDLHLALFLNDCGQVSAEDTIKRIREARTTQYRRDDAIALKFNL